MYASTSEKRTLHHEGHEGCTKDTKATGPPRCLRTLRAVIPFFAPKCDCARSAQKNHGGTENTEIPGRGSSVTSVPPWRICLAPSRPVSISIGGIRCAFPPYDLLTLQRAGGQGVGAEQVADGAGVAGEEAGEPALDRRSVGRAVEMQVQVARAVVRAVERNARYCNVPRRIGPVIRLRDLPSRMQDVLLHGIG